MKNIDLTGQRFGRLVVVKRADDYVLPNGKLLDWWLCQCDCGNEKIVTGNSLRCSYTRSCGCLRKEATGSRNRANILERYNGTSISMIRKETPTKASTTGVRGVYWAKDKGCYIARIMIKGKEIRLGQFKTLQEAAKARKRAEEEYYKPVIDEYEALTSKDISAEGDNTI